MRISRLCAECAFFVVSKCLVGRSEKQSLTVQPLYSHFFFRQTNLKDSEALETNRRCVVPDPKLGSNGCYMAVEYAHRLNAIIS
jgi:hypothetical protein